MNATAPCSIAAAVALFPSTEAALASLLPGERAAAGEALARMDRLCGLAVVGSEQCLAAVDPVARAPAAQTAVLCGTRDGCLATDTAFYRGALAGQASPRLFAYTLHSSPVGAVSIQHGLWGPASTAVGSSLCGLQVLEEALAMFAAQHAQACLVLSCDVAWQTGRDAVAALYLTHGTPTAGPDRRWRLVAVQTAFQSQRPQAALDAVLGRLQAQVAGLDGATVLPADGPPLATLVTLVTLQNDPASLHPALALGQPSTGMVVITAVDPLGYAGAAVLVR